MRSGTNVNNVYMYVHYKANHTNKKNFHMVSIRNLAYLAILNY